MSEPRRRYTTIGTGRHRPFQITLGLHEGYGEPAIIRTRDDALAGYKAWLVRRMAAGKRYLTGVVGQEETLVYAHRREDGKIRSIVEPFVTVSGVVSVLYNDDLDDMGVWEMLYDLATHLAKYLRQDRVTVAYAGDVRVYGCGDQDPTMGGKTGPAQ